MIVAAPQTIQEVQEVVRAHERVSPRGGESKPGLILHHEGAFQIKTNALRGILQYQPDEFTFTALAGTPLLEIEAHLGQHGQYLPFDPPLVEAGATLGGAAASGLSGAGRYRFGGGRDFILGVRYVDSEGRLVSGGGKVVKNAAGFDLPKLMIGCLGQYGVLVELSFKVFPLPQAFCTLQAEYAALGQALADLNTLNLQPLELFALELIPAVGVVLLRARLGGRVETLAARAKRLRNLLHSDQLTSLEGEAEARLWRDEREFAWAPEGYCLVKIPLTPRRVSELDEILAAHQAHRRYSVGANLCWVAWQADIADLHLRLKGLKLSGMVVRGDAGSVLIGAAEQNEFARRVKQALDPYCKFPVATYAA
mgnify:CR=1 FL=1